MLLSVDEEPHTCPDIPLGVLTGKPIPIRLVSPADQQNYAAAEASLEKDWKVDFKKSALTIASEALP